MPVDPFSRKALLTARETQTYAPRTRTWPPPEYVPPTEAEFAELRGRLAGMPRVRSFNHDSSGLLRRSKMTDEQLVRSLQVADVAPSRLWGMEDQHYDWVRALRTELRRRQVVFTSMRPHGCENCPRCPQVRFEATQKTHPGLENEHDELIQSIWLCVRCWSELAS